MELLTDHWVVSQKFGRNVGVFEEQSVEDWQFLHKTGNHWKYSSLSRGSLFNLEARCGPCNLRCHSKDVIKGSFVAVVNTGSFLLQAHWKIRGNQQGLDSSLGCVLDFNNKMVENFNAI